MVSFYRASARAIGDGGRDVRVEEINIIRLIG